MLMAGMFNQPLVHLSSPICRVRFGFVFFVEHTASMRDKGSDKADLVDNGAGRVYNLHMDK